jgi:hypothetical protein
MIFDAKTIFDDVIEALAPAEQFDSSVEYVALMCLIKDEVERRMMTCLNEFYRKQLQ